GLRDLRCRADVEAAARRPGSVVIDAEEGRVLEWPRRALIDPGPGTSIDGVEIAARRDAGHLGIGADHKPRTVRGRRLRIGAIARGDDDSPGGPVAAGAGGRPGAEADRVIGRRGDWRGAIRQLAGEVIVVERRRWTKLHREVALEAVEDGDIVEL